MAAKKANLEELKDVVGGLKGKNNPIEAFYYIITFSLNGSAPKKDKSELFDSKVSAAYAMNKRIDALQAGGYRVLSYEVKAE